MTGLIAGSGLGLLIALAAAAGLAADRDARNSAWRRIAAARRTHREEAGRLAEWAIELHDRATALDARERRLDRRDREPGGGTEP